MDPTFATDLCSYCDCWQMMGKQEVIPVTLAHYTHSVGEDNRNVADQMGAAWGMVN